MLMTLILAAKPFSDKDKDIIKFVGFFKILSVAF